MTVAGVRGRAAPKPRVSRKGPSLTVPTHWYRLEVRRKIGGTRAHATTSVLVQVAGEGELKVHLDAYKGRLDGYSLARVHECCACGKVAPWDGRWSWFGSYQEMDEGRPVRMFCSAACRAKGPKGEVIEGD